MLNDILPRFNRTQYWEDMEKQAGPGGDTSGPAEGGAEGESASVTVARSRAPTASHGRRMSALMRFSSLPVPGETLTHEAAAGVLPSSSKSTQIGDVVVPESVRGAWRGKDSASARRAASKSMGLAAGRVPVDESVLLDDDLLSDAAGFLSRKTISFGLFSQRDRLREEEGARVEEARLSLLSTPAHEGYAMKRGNHHRSWKRRWFVLGGVPASACSLASRDELDGAMAMDPHEAAMAGLAGVGMEEDHHHAGEGSRSGGPRKNLGGKTWGRGSIANPEFGSAGAGVAIGYFEDESAKQLKGLIHMKDVHSLRARSDEAATPTHDENLCIELQMEGRSHFVQTQSLNEHERWLRGLLAGWGLSLDSAHEKAGVP